MIVAALAATCSRSMTIWWWMPPCVAMRRALSITPVRYVVSKTQYLTEHVLNLRLFISSFLAELLLEGRRYTWSQAHHYLCPATHRAG